MSHVAQRTVCLVIAALTSGASASTGPRPAAASGGFSPAQADRVPADGTADDSCLAQALCRLKERIAHGKPWTPAQCGALARGVTESAARHALSPALLLAVMIQESDLDEQAARLSHSRGAIAKDSGLMGIRCVLDGRGRCTNGLVRGLSWRQVMNPLTNIELGARYLAYYRDGAGRSRITVRVRQDDGTVATIHRDVPCRHTDHAYWAHYNHGTRYIAHGQARLYPLHVGALYAALSETLGLDASGLPRLAGASPRLTSADQGPARRSRALCAAVHSARPACAAPTIAFLSAPAVR
jgi:hypothetical protein